MLQANSVQFNIHNRPIIDRATVCLQAGELTALVGPNGAGKSTLFKLISGDLTCKHGNVTYNGLPLNRLKPKQLACLRAVMPQHTSVTFPFRAIEVVELGLLLSNQTYATTTIEEVMRTTHTWHLRKELLGNLSGGEKQRVQLARVLAQIWEQKPHPRYLLLDEPTSSMDISQQHHVLQVLGELKHRNIGVLAILHDLNLAANYADRVVLLKNGTILHQGRTRDVMTSGNLEEVFDYPVQVHSEGPRMPLFISSLPAERSSQTYTFKLA
nr:heme ABC transporter ATP-binding protein [Cytophagales bacterium]